MEFYFGESHVVAGTAKALADGDSLFIAAPAVVGSRTGAIGVSAGASAYVNVFGTLMSARGRAFESTGGYNLIHVGVGGAIAGGAFNDGMGLFLGDGGNKITNEGTISGGDGIFVTAGDGSNNIVNSGAITGTYVEAIVLVGIGNFIGNSGVIATSGSECILLDASTSAPGDGNTNHIDNSGTIMAGRSGSGSTAIESFGNANTVITNTGHIAGDIFFGELADTYDGSVGTLTGRIDGRGGNDTLLGGAERDVFIGGEGADTMDGGAGRDTFSYFNANDSSGRVHDTLVEFDFRKDKIDFVSAVTAIDKTVATGKLDDATFNTDLHTAMAGHLKPHHAILFTPNSGSYAGHTFLVVDGDGNAGFHVGTDLTFELQDAVALASLDPADFI